MRRIQLMVLVCTWMVPAILFAQTIEIPSEGSSQGGAAEVTQKPTAAAPVQAPKETEYQGVVPGKKDVVEHTQVKRVSSRASHELTWVGFQKMDNRDRVFLQFQSVPEYTSRIEGKVLILTLKSTAPTARNFFREIDTQYFGSPVQNIKTKHKNGTTTVRITFDRAPMADMHVEDTYLFVDVTR